MKKAKTTNEDNQLHLSTLSKEVFTTDFPTSKQTKKILCWISTVIFIGCQYRRVVNKSRGFLNDTKVRSSGIPDRHRTPVRTMKNRLVNYFVVRRIDRSHPLCLRRSLCPKESPLKSNRTLSRAVYLYTRHFTGTWTLSCGPKDRSDTLELVNID